MAKISPVSIKYMIHATLIAEGALEKPDVIGALFGQTEGLLGADLEMRDLQKEGKIGRIEADLERKGKQTIGQIKIPTALDQSETTLIAAAIETIERVGPSDAQIEIDRIEDVRGSKRDYILERAKKLMGQIQGSSDSREISNEIKDSKRISSVQEYGDSKLAFGGDLENKELIVVEGRADVLNLIRAGIKNVIGMNGTKLPKEVQELSSKKDIILFVDGDRGGKLIIQNVLDNTKIHSIAIAPDGKEVEELTSKEILIALRKKIPASEFSSDKNNGNSKQVSNFIFNEEVKKKLKEISDKNNGSKKSIILDKNLKEIKYINLKALSGELKRLRETPSILIIDGNVTKTIISVAEEKNVKVIVAKTFATTDTKIKLLSF